MALPKVAYADNWDLGFSGLYNYSNCPLYNVVGRHYINELANQLGSSIHGYPVGRVVFKKLDNDAWEKHLVNSANGGNGLADSVHFYAYAGHGLNYSTYSAAHFNSANGSSYNHGCSYDYINAGTNEINWGSNKLRWAVMQTCNFLNNSNTTKENYLRNMFKGLRILMGYRTTMYMVANEGYTFGKNIYNHGKLVDSFFAAARAHQTGRLSTTIRAVAMGYRPALYNDTRTTSPTKAPNWNSTQFSIKELPISP